MNNAPIVYGIDVAESAYLMHWVDPGTGEVMN